MPNQNVEAGRETQPMRLRAPDELKERVRRSAAANRRSMNSEILVLIEKALGNDTAETAATIAAE